MPDRQPRIRRWAGVVAAAGVVLAACSSGGPTSKARSSSSTTTTTTRPDYAVFDQPQSPAALQPGSDPSVLPGPVLIADRSNNRLLVVSPQGQVLWQFPQPGDLQPGQTFLVPDDAFFTPDGKQIVITEEDDFVVTVVDIATHKIVYRYGTPGTHGMGPNQLWNPDDAMILPNGDLLTADIKNCRLVIVGPGAHTPSQVIGTSTNNCYHSPPSHWGSPNGAFPMANGHYLVTEINGDWVDEIGLDGTVYSSAHPPGLSYPSDSNEVSPGVYVTVDYSDPGTLETFDGSGKLLWRYQPLPGDPQLNHPSLAEPLPNGDFLMNDDYNDRVVVIDPHTNKVVWQYGFTGHPGTAPGYLNQPDGVDLAPPHSLLIRHHQTMGLPPSSTAPGGSTSTSGG